MVNGKEEKITICNVINYEKDIAPFPLVKVYSGVGSGKSYFAAKMITGSEEYKIPEQTVLLITSRRSKVEETLKELGVSVTEHITRYGNLNYEVWQTGEDRPQKYDKNAKGIRYTDDFGALTYLTYNKSVVCTNAYISAYLRNIYIPEDPTTHIWNKFDSIIIDEVHSLVTDSTYQTSTFDVLAFIHEYLKLYRTNQLQECACKHLILMTGTPQTFESAVELDFPKELTHKIDLFDRCENVVPKNIILVDEQTAQNRIRELTSNGKRVIYFTNHTLTESAVTDKFKLPDTVKVGVSFSNEDKRKALTEEEQDRIGKIDTSLATNSLIPDDIQLFVTTSRNKEGINIHNTDFQNMFIETHLMYDVVQMAGRVRCGVENLYIITDASQFEYDNNSTDILFSKKRMVANTDYDSDDEANRHLINSYLKNDKEAEKSYEYRRKSVMYYVKYIESRFDYVRYNIFSQQFEFFYAKEKAEKMADTQADRFKKMLSSANNEYIQRWFPNSDVIREATTGEKATKYLNGIIGNNEYAILSQEELDKHISAICEMLNSDLKSTNSILHSVDKNFNCIKSGKNYILYYGKEDPRPKKKSMKRHGNR